MKIPFWQAERERGMGGFSDGSADLAWVVASFYGVSPEKGFSLSELFGSLLRIFPLHAFAIHVRSTLCH